MDRMRDDISDTLDPTKGVVGVRTNLQRVKEVTTPNLHTNIVVLAISRCATSVKSATERDSLPLFHPPPFLFTSTTDQPITQLQPEAAAVSAGTRLLGLGTLPLVRVVIALVPLTSLGFHSDLC